MRAKTKRIYMYIIIAFICAFITLHFINYPQITPEQYDTEIKKAIQDGDYDRYIALLQEKNAKNVRNQGGMTDLMFDALIGNRQAVLFDLENGADVNLASNAGDTALMYASESGHLDIVKLLLENGADVNAVDIGGDTALIDAVRRGHTEIVKVLLKAGADKTKIGFFNETALSLAKKGGHKEIIKLLEE